MIRDLQNTFLHTSFIFIFIILLFIPSLYFFPSFSLLYTSFPHFSFPPPHFNQKKETLLNHFWRLVHLSQWHCWTRSEYSYMEHTLYTDTQTYFWRGRAQASIRNRCVEVESLDFSAAMSATTKALITF